MNGLQTLRSSSEEGGGTEGGGGQGKRTGGQAAIDDLLSQDQGVNSDLMSREGTLTIESSQEAGEKDSGKKQYRNAQDIQQVLLSHNQVIKYCYERELRRYPSLKGKVVVRITINPQGEVVDATILSSSLNNERVERCIVARISHWKDFKSVNPQAGNVTFRQTYIFGY
ncbi:MAG: AgmX/PglI C-terminal domain-containing protein [bacterium]